MENQPKFSVILPFYNAQTTLAACLKSILANDYPNFEVICVDDRSTDDSPAIAQQFPVLLLQMIHRAGAAAARNLAAAAAAGEILYFTDADVLVPPNILQRLAEEFAARADLDACFGAYTIMPAAGNFASIYKNLIHHHTHQTSNAHATTFWCGCGAIRRDAFARAQGFNESYLASSVEDIELGYRMSKSGMNIELKKDLRVTHAKKYTLPSLIRSDLLDRAIPWTKLMARQNIFRADLNLQITNILSGLLLALVAPFLLASLFFLPGPYAWSIIGVVAAAYFLLNARIWWYVFNVKGLLFSLLFLVMYIITYLYSSMGFALGLLMYLGERWRERKSK